METKNYDVIIIGGGASGTALLYVLAKYTNLNRIALVEKNPTLGSVNSHAKNNSQNLHVGDVETHYSLEKAAQVKPAAELVLKYIQTLDTSLQTKLLRKMPKMVLGVGADEVKILEDRYPGLKKIFPNLQKIDRARLAELEPEVMRGRPDNEPVVALYDTAGYAVNFGKLAEVLAREAVALPNKTVDIFCNEKVNEIKLETDHYHLKTNQQDLIAPVVVVDADAHSLGFAKKLGYGQNFSLIPIAGNFYFSPTKLNGKVNTVQDSRLPFASVHGDPDLTRDQVTRWGPTARFFPVLESRNYASTLAYFKSSGLGRLKTWKSFGQILFEPLRFKYLFKNLLYEFPVIGKRLFLKEIHKIVPTMRAKDLVKAKGYGGMRLQRVDTETSTLLLGEGKIIGKNIIFNMTPSPGASVCLYNARRDAEQIMQFFSGKYVFDGEKMQADLGADPITNIDPSLSSSYAS